MQKSPFDIRELAKKGYTSEERFFRLLSEQNNYVDPKTVQDFYMGLVRLITKELREVGFVRLPHLGDFGMLKAKDRMNLSGKYRIMIIGKYLLKFYPKDAWKSYFDALEKKGGREGKLDPREKVLNMNLDSYEPTE